MTGDCRIISRDHCGLLVSTIRMRWSSLTRVARSTAAPTAARHAKPTFPLDSGASRRSVSSADGMTWDNARISVSLKSEVRSLSQSTNRMPISNPKLRMRQTSDFLLQTYDLIIAFVQLILASASPRRADLLRAAGFSFDVVVPDVDESPRDGERAEDYVRRLAREKADAALKGCAPSVVQGF